MAKIKNESSVSRLLQQRVPVTESTDEFQSHSNITEYDTPEKSITEDLNKEYISVSEVVYKNNRISVVPKMFEYVEIVPSSNITEYNKINVLIDREGHQFYFDYTENNKRTHLRHPSGTYFTIDDNGGYNLKVIQDFNTIVKGADNKIVNLAQNLLVKHDRKVSVKGNDYHSIGLTRNRTVGSNDGLVVGGSRYVDISYDRITNISGKDVLSIDKYKEQEITGAYTVISHDFISFQSPIITLDAGSLMLRSKSSFTEKVSGKREILAEKLVLSGMDGVSLTSMGNYTTVVKGISEETVSGVPALPSGTDTKIITVNLGGFKVETKAGAISFSSVLPLPITLENALGSVTIGTTGKIDLASPLSDISIKESGIIELNGSTGSITVGMANTEIDHSAMIKIGSGASSEFAVLGAKLMNWLNAHTHNSSGGPTSPPIQPAMVTDFGSNKVYIE